MEETNLLEKPGKKLLYHHTHIVHIEPTDVSISWLANFNSLYRTETWHKFTWLPLDLVPILCSCKISICTYIIQVAAAARISEFCHFNGEKNFDILLYSPVMAGVQFQQ